MKYLLLFLLSLLLLSFNVYSACPDLPASPFGHWCQYCWETPTERENNESLPLSEIAGFILEGKDSLGIWHILQVDNKTNSIHWPQFEPCLSCTEIRIRTIDTEQRVSEWAYPTCPPATPLICQ